MRKKVLIAMAGKLGSRLPWHHLSDNRGIAAVEFALIVPILLLLSLGAIEISLAVAVDRKISRISSSVSDLITQGSSYDKSGLNAIADIAKRIMMPYSDDVKISIVAVNIQSNQSRVAWSYGINGGVEPAKGSSYPIPDSIKTNGTFLIATTVSTNHKPVYSFVGYDEGKLSFDQNSIKLSEAMFLRPRLGGTIDCSDCNR